MKTVVHQSYRTHDIPAWLGSCMQSVATWARNQKFDYRFIDDRLFDYVPDWYRRGAGNNVQVVTNLARLLMARDLLAEYERTIWVDADVLVFDQDAFRIDVTREFAFCREVWLTTQWGAIRTAAGVNNSVAVFVRENSFLVYGIWAHEELVRNGARIQPHGTTTRLLTELHRAAPIPLLTNVGVLSPPVARDIRDGRGAMPRAYAAAHGAPMHAINLGASLCGKPHDGRVLGDDDYRVIVDVFERTQGALFREDAAVDQGLHQP